MRLSILGGSSPFVLEFIRALKNADGAGISQITLFGRDRRALDLIADFASYQLGIPVEPTCDPEQGTAGFQILIQQIRFGGLAGREADEQAAIAAGIVPDESLGRAALTASERLARPLFDLSARIAAGSPDAAVINMTNPLGVSTSVMARAGLKRVIGICELPTVTMAKAAAICGVDPRECEWTYRGFNHRGFITNLSHEGADLLERVAQSGIGEPFGGLAGEDLLAFGALPTKYFQLFAFGKPVSSAGRAASLARLRERILGAIATDSARFPDGLAERAQPWWEVSVVPLIEALGRTTPTRHLVNMPDARGVTREGLALVDSQQIAWCDEPPLSALAQPAVDWLRAFARHERATLAYAHDPTAHTFDAADRADPLSPSYDGPHLWQPAHPYRAGPPASPTACAAG